MQFSDGRDSSDAERGPVQLRGRERQSVRAAGGLRWNPVHRSTSGRTSDGAEKTLQTDRQIHEGTRKKYAGKSLHYLKYLRLCFFGSRKRI